MDGWGNTYWQEVLWGMQLASKLLTANEAAEAEPARTAAAVAMVNFMVLVGGGWGIGVNESGLLLRVW